MESLKRLPVGIENFQEITNGRYYFVDKTAFIRDLALNHDKVNLITRPRRFGKTLNMNMLKTFFDVNGDKAAFDGLEISKDKDFCDTYMGKYPVISISLKELDGLSFESAFKLVKNYIVDEAGKFLFLSDSDKLDTKDKADFQALLLKDEFGLSMMDDATLKTSLKFLCSLLYKHYGVKPILLIDEYDVPLDKANQHGYYDEMVDTAVHDISEYGDFEWFAEEKEI